VNHTHQALEDLQVSGTEMNTAGDTIAQAGYWNEDVGAQIKTSGVILRRSAQSIQTAGTHLIG
jgi:hypothetical protein